MFQFRRFPSCTYGFSTRYTSFTCVDCSIRKSTDRCPLTAPHSLSQLVASFFGSQCQGIPLALFVAWPCVLLGSFKTRLLQRLALWNCRFRFKILVFQYFRISSLYLLSLYSVFNVHSNKNLAAFVHEVWLSPNFFVAQFLELCEFHEVKSRWSSIRFAISNFGGDERDRTDDPLLAKQVLSQLSYTPIPGFWRSCRLFFVLPNLKN